MKRFKNLRKVIKQTGIGQLLLSYIIMILICSILLVIIEPNFNTLMDGLWYSVVAIATVGFGDIVVTTTLGKIISMILILSGVIIVALFTGTIVHYYQTVNEARRKDKLMDLLDKLERLPELSKEELKQISKQIKETRLNRKE